MPVLSRAQRAAGREPGSTGAVAASFDPLKIVIDVSGLGISGYQAAHWMREHQRVTVGLSDHRRVVAHFTHADDRRSATVLLDALEALVRAADDLRTARRPACSCRTPPTRSSSRSASSSGSDSWTNYPTARRCV
ncbi:hypothetical protein AB0425_30655 [Actinosynnema sp. NPDC051121]